MGKVDNIFHSRISFNYLEYNVLLTSMLGLKL